MTALPSVTDAAAGENADPVDLDRGHELLSVAEIQQALRELRGRRPRATALGAPTHAREDRNPEQPPAGSELAPTRQRVRRQERRPPAEPRGDIGRPGWLGRDDTAGDTGDRAALRAAWVAVVAAHAGAGASTVALALSDAAAAAGRRVHLIECAHPSRSGLVGAASEERGTDATGVWRRGVRSGVTIDRRATAAAPGGWPELPVGEGPAMTIVDLGFTAVDEATRPADDRTLPVVVCRPTVPGVRLAEQLLAQLARRPVVLAVVGPSRWPGEVTASLGPRLRDLQARGRMVPVATDRRLQITGLTPSALPKPVRAAGRALLDLLDDTRPGATARLSGAPVDAASTPEETRR